MTQKTSKKLSATPIPSTEKYLYGVCVIVNKKLSPTFDAVKLTPSTHNTGDRKLPARVKGKVYSSVIRPAMVYGIDTVAITKKQVEEMEVAEMKMLRFAMGEKTRSELSKDEKRQDQK